MDDPLANDLQNYLKNAQRFSVRDSFCWSAVDGKDSIAFLDSSVTIGQSSGNDFVNLEWNEMSNDGSCFVTS